MEDLTGKQFGPYLIEAPIGEGGMAAVYKAYQASMERYVAVKVLPRHLAESDEFIARFQREARMLAQLQHPHILPVFDYGQADGYTYIVMPFVQSGTLDKLLKTQRMSLLEIRRTMTQLGDALGYAHARGMIHRDVKPANVLIDERGNCLLTDFGLARMTQTTGKLTSDGAVMGTPAYMSPEQGSGAPLDGRSDIYSLGIIFYEMITGQVPYSAETPVAIVFKHIQDPLPPARELAPDLPENVEMVLARSLEKKAIDRYQTAEDFVRAVQQAIPANATGRAAPKALDSIYNRLLDKDSAGKASSTDLRPSQQRVIATPPSEPPVTPAPVSEPAPNPVSKMPATPVDDEGLRTLISSQPMEPVPAPLPAASKKTLPSWAIIGMIVIGAIVIAFLVYAATMR